MAKVFIGQIIHTKSLNEFEIFTKGFISVDINGKINAIGDDFSSWNSRNDIYEEIHLTEDQFLMPGLVDCHIHAPQGAQIGLGLDIPLLDWLNSYTFPLEAKFADQEFAKKVYKHVVETTIKCGTTLASYFGTIHKDSTLILAKEIAQQGQRALVGKVCSNCNSPDYYVETTEESIKGTKDFVHDMQKLKTDLVRPTITPRFSLTCSKELLTQLGNIAKEHDLHIQSHISENVNEIEFVKSLFSTSYAEAYYKTGLLTKKTIMAHAVHLEDEEITLLSKTKTSVAHCPSSNTNLKSGFCDVLRIMQHGIKVGLGTDVSGGNRMSIQEAILRTLDVSHHLEFIKKHDIKGSGKLEIRDESYQPLNYKQAIYLATLGGAEALSMNDITGNFVVGKDFDALLIDTSLYPLHNYGYYDEETYNNKSNELKLLEMVQKFIYVGDDRNITKVFVAGKQIKKL